MRLRVARRQRSKSLEEFIRPSKKKLQKVKKMINVKLNQHPSCAPGCHCGDEVREEFPEMPSLHGEADSVRLSDEHRELFKLQRDQKVQNESVWNERMHRWSKGTIGIGLPEEPAAGASVVVTPAARAKGIGLPEVPAAGRQLQLRQPRGPQGSVSLDSSHGGAS